MRRRTTADKPFPEIRDSDREEPDWAAMSPRERREHRLDVWAYYEALPGSPIRVQEHPERDAVIAILHLHTPPFEGEK